MDKALLFFKFPAYVPLCRTELIDEIYDVQVPFFKGLLQEYDSAVKSGDKKKIREKKRLIGEAKLDSEIGLKKLNSYQVTKFFLGFKAPSLRGSINQIP